MVLLHFTEGDSIQKLETTVKDDMQKNIDHFVDELKKIRTGRAHPSLVEDLMVEAYGQQMRLRDLATISAPEAQLISIQPWDQSIVPFVEKALMQANLGGTPQVDGALVRLKLPPMSATQREQLIKAIGKRLEESKVALRTIRKDYQNYIRDIEKNKDISEDTAKRLQNSLQKITDEYVAKVQTLGDKKEEEIKTF